ncbi:MAG TPA: thioredoxin [Ignavibacteria bacterium]|nr:thioredoxin [Ignavibacteria bacterium]HMR00431.1 thioredoxin [Ignavibacteria bacterium]
MKKTKITLHILILAGIFSVLLASCGKKEDRSVNYNTPSDQNKNVQKTITNSDIKTSPEPVKKENINKENNTKGSTKMVHLTAAEFKQKVFNYETQKEWKFTGDVPVIIDFYADWCGPCKMVAPVLEELSKEYDGKVQIYKVDTEAEQELASVFGIRSIPSILFIPMEGKPQMSMGALPKESFVKAINEILLVN